MTAAGRSPSLEERAVNRPGRALGNLRQQVLGRDRRISSAPPPSPPPPTPKHTAAAAAAAAQASLSVSRKPSCCPLSLLLLPLPSKRNSCVPAPPPGAKPINERPALCTREMALTARHSSSRLINTPEALQLLAYFAHLSAQRTSVSSRTSTRPESFHCRSKAKRYYSTTIYWHFRMNQYPPKKF